MTTATARNTRPKKPTRRRPGARKLSISLGPEVVRWLKSGAPQFGSVSAVVAEAAARMQREEARRELLGLFGDTAQVTDKERAAIRASWRP